MQVNKKKYRIWVLVRTFGLNQLQLNGFRLRNLREVWTTLSIDVTCPIMSILEILIACQVWSIRLTNYFTERKCTNLPYFYSHTTWLILLILMRFFLRYIQLCCVFFLSFSLSLSILLFPFQPEIVLTIRLSFWYRLILFLLKEWLKLGLLDRRIVNFENHKSSCIMNILYLNLVIKFVYSCYSHFA